MRPFLISLVPLLVSLAAAADDQLPAELPPEQEKQAIALAESTGASIYRHDHAAAVATDSVRTLQAFRNDKRLRGWVTEQRGDSIVVTFVGAPDELPAAALYRVETSADGSVAGEPVVL